MVAKAEQAAKQKKPFNLAKWAKSREGQKTIIVLAFVFIPLLLLVVFTYLPFAEMVKFSFYKMKYATPVDKRVFVGWQNYIDVFKRKDCFSARKAAGRSHAGGFEKRQDRQNKGYDSIHRGTDRRGGIQRRSRPQYDRKGRHS